jgi:hypothetical protein
MQLKVNMNMSSEIFEKRAFEVFDTTEINEPLLMLYKQLSFAIRDHCDTMTLDKTSLRRILRDKTVSTFPTIYGDTSIYSILKANLIKIFERDPLVRQYFRLEYGDDDTLIIKVIGISD